MSVPANPDMIEILRGALDDVEHEPGLDQRHPTVIEFKRAIRKSLAELQAADGEDGWGRAA